MSLDKSAPKSVWISTPPRTGSMWLFNVTREILRRAEMEVLPEEVPQSDDDMISLATTEAWSDENPNRIWVLKIHQVLSRELPRSRIITARRDPRDVIVSYRRFMRTTFEKALEVAELVVAFAGVYEDYPPDYLLCVDYADIEAAPEELLHRIAAFLETPVPQRDAKEIADMYRREKVRQLTDNMTQDMDARLANGRLIDIDMREIVYFSRDNYRAFDRRTGFQTGHVSKYQSGDWRHILTADEQRVVWERIGNWLQTNGYSRDR